MENKRINIKCFNTIEYKMLEVFLNGLYDKGLYIEKIINYEIYFSEKPTKKYVYSTAITNIKDEDEIFEYIDFCESIGWEYMYEVNGIYIFRSDVEKNLLPINTDESIENEIFENKNKKDRKNFIYNIVMAFLTFLVLILCFSSKVIAQNKNLFLLVLNPTIFITEVCYLVKNKIEYRKFIDIEREEERKDFVYNVFNGRSYKTFIINTILFFIILPIIIYFLIKKYVFILGYLIVILYVVIYIIFMKKNRYKGINGFYKKFNHEKVSLIFSVIILILGTGIVLSKDKQYSVILNENVLKCNYIESNMTSDYGFVLEEGSPFVPKAYKYVEGSRDGLIVTTEYYKAINSIFAKSVYNGFKIKYRKSDINKFDADKFNADEVITIDKNIVVIRKGSEVISFEIDDTNNIVSDENIKLFNRIINE